MYVNVEFVVKAVRFTGNELKSIGIRVERTVVGKKHGAHYSCPYLSDVEAFIRHELSVKWVIF